MDDLDRTILAALAADSSQPTSKLARKLGVARSTIQARIERLEAAGLIAGYTIRLGDVALARRIKATALLHIEPRTTAAVLQRLKTIPEIEVVTTTTGRFDMMLQLAASTTSRLDEVLDKIGIIPGVLSSESLIQLSTKLDRSL